MVPLSFTLVLYVNVIVPVAPGARFRGLPVVEVSVCVTVPVLFGVGGFGLDVMVVCVAVVRFLIVMTRRKLVLATMAVTGLPERSVIWNETTCSERRIQLPGPPTVTFARFAYGGPVIVFVKRAR